MGELMYIVAFNGPPESGKDTFADALVKRVEAIHNIPVKLESLSFPLRSIAYAMVGWSSPELDGDNYELFKRVTFPQFGGITGRQLMIDVSEKFLKPTYGTEIMARMLIARVEASRFNGLLLIRDCGFQLEVSPLTEWVGAQNLYVARCHREGKNFSNDSRELVYHQNWSAMQSDFYNDSTLDNWITTEAGRLYGRLVNQAGWTF